MMAGMNTQNKNMLCPTPVLARQLGVTARWLRAEAEAGRIPSLKAENVYLFDPDVVINLLAERAREGVRNENC